MKNTPGRLRGRGHQGGVDPERPGGGEHPPAERVVADAAAETGPQAEAGDGREEVQLGPGDVDRGGGGVLEGGCLQQDHRLAEADDVEGAVEGAHAGSQRARRSGRR
ncbi:hypothetical protein GCM10018962_69110 [Dactylosporangium matsuzakiense]